MLKNIFKGSAPGLTKGDKIVEVQKLCSLGDDKTISRMLLLAWDGTKDNLCNLRFKPSVLKLCDLNYAFWAATKRQIWKRFWILRNCHLEWRTVRRDQRFYSRIAFKSSKIKSWRWRLFAFARFWMSFCKRSPTRGQYTKKLLGQICKKTSWDKLVKIVRNFTNDEKRISSSNVESFDRLVLFGAVPCNL